MIPESRCFIAGKAKHTHRWTGAKDGLSAPQKVQIYIKPEENFKAEPEGHQELLGKAGVLEDIDVDLLQNPLSVPTAYLPLAGLARLFGMA